jgi:RNA polymerase sigma factor (sigma-70 family)
MEDAETDNALIAAVLEDGSEAAFRALYHRHTPRMYGVARRLTDSDADAEDVLQDAWTRAASRLRDFAGRSTLNTWLVGVVVNVARECLAKRGRWPEALLHDVPIPDIGVGAGERVDIERAIRALPPGYRTAFVLHDVEGFTHEEIGQRCGWTAGTSKTLLFRARRALRAALSPKESMVTESR